MDKELIKEITFKQYGSNCGIYALIYAINLHLYKNDTPPLSKKTMRQFIGALTKKAVDLKYSIVGEFFDMNLYIEFINSPEAEEVINNFVPGLKIDADLVDREYYLLEDAAPSKDEELILAYARPKNTHIVPILEIEKQEVKYIDSRKLCTKKLTGSEYTRFKVRPYRRKRAWQRPFFYKPTWIMLSLLMYKLILNWVYSCEYLLSLYLADYYTIAYTIAIISGILGYGIFIFLMRCFKIARHVEMRIELRNHKDLKDITSIKLDKIVKLKFSNVILGSHECKIKQ